MRALFVALVLTALCHAQGAPATVAAREVDCRDVAGRDQKCYEAKVTNSGPQNIVGYTIAVDVVSFTGDWKRTETFSTQNKLKPGKSHGETYDYPYAARLANARLEAVKFADGTEWRRGAPVADKSSKAE